MKTHFTSKVLFLVIAFVCFFDTGEFLTNTSDDGVQETKCEKKWWWWFYDCPTVSTATSDGDKEQTNEAQNSTSDSPIDQNETNVTEDDNVILKQNKTENSDPKLIESDMMQHDTSLAEASSVYTDKKWPNAIIPFEISDEYTSDEKQVIQNAMNDFQSKSCIKFIPHNDEEDYIYIWKNPNTGCASHIGRRGGKQDVSLKNRCVNPTTVKHELMHAIGFVHEQSRSDRDDFVTIYWDNVIPEQRFQFNKYEFSAVQMLKTPYDLKSIMHYPWNMFAVDDTKPTITTKDGSTNILPSDDFTKTDILEINRLYNCNPNDCWDSPYCNQQEQYHWQDGHNGRVQWARNCDFSGYVIDKKLSSAEECGGLCISNIDCTHFTWGIGSYCYIKSAPEDADIYPFPGAVCGYITL